MFPKYATETVLAPDADRYNTDPATDVINTALYSYVVFELHEGTGGTGTATITVEECTALDGTGATAIADFRYQVRQALTAEEGVVTAGAVGGYTTVAGANKIVRFFIDPRDLSNDSPFVRLQITEVVDSPVDAVVIAHGFGGRYAEETMPSAIV